MAASEESFLDIILSGFHATWTRLNRSRVSSWPHVFVASEPLALWNVMRFAVEVRGAVVSLCRMESISSSSALDTQV
jgi:hypothetical protein